MRVDRASRRITAQPSRIFEALTDQEAVQQWLPPVGAKGTVEAFEPRPGGAFRMTLIFDNSGETGSRKSSSNSDIVEGKFVEVVPDKLVRQHFNFKSENPAFAGTMTMTWTVSARTDGAEVLVEAENVPNGIDPHEHEAGMMSSLANLEKYLLSNVKQT